jgi:hypothetical protein
VAVIIAPSAGIAQLVERNLAKVEVESSRLFSRSRILERTPSCVLFLLFLPLIAPGFLTKAGILPKHSIPKGMLIREDWSDRDEFRSTRS